jgi:hypothetical protein
MSLLRVFALFRNGSAISEKLRRERLGRQLAKMLPIAGAIRREFEASALLVSREFQVLFG